MSLVMMTDGYQSKFPVIEIHKSKINNKMKKCKD